MQNKNKTNNQNLVERIEIEYDRVMSIGDHPMAPGEPLIAWDYHERLTIDRATQTIEHYRKPFAECDITNIYHIAEGISELIGERDADFFCEMPPDKPATKPKDPKNKQTYKMIVTMTDGTQQAVGGDFNVEKLPLHWEALLGIVLQFMSFYGIGEMFEETFAFDGGEEA